MVSTVGGNVAMPDVRLSLTNNGVIFGEIKEDGTEIIFTQDNQTPPPFFPSQNNQNPPTQGNTNSAFTPTANNQGRVPSRAPSQSSAANNTAEIAVNEEAFGESVEAGSADNDSVMRQNEERALGISNEAIQEIPVDLTPLSETLVSNNQATGNSNTFLWVLIGGAVLIIIGGVGVFVHRRRKLE